MGDGVVKVVDGIGAGVDDGRWALGDCTTHSSCLIEQVVRGETWATCLPSRSQATGNPVNQGCRCRYEDGDIQFGGICGMAMEQRGPAKERTCFTVAVEWKNQDGSRGSAGTRGALGILVLALVGSAAHFGR